MQVLVGRISSVMVMLLAILWSTQGGRYSSIFRSNQRHCRRSGPTNYDRFRIWRVLQRRGTKEASISTLAFGFFYSGLCVLF